ncbi:zinc-ribbon domain-containing protein [Blautia sp. NSJ-157]|uniref:zinc-ribbon domain-containing protein n=1 Tax=unclassified Blautia TaxID=2648079 RepID=UPI003FA4A371
MNDCPYTARLAVWTGYNDLQSCFPDIAEQWSEKNRFLKPDKIYKFSKMKIWWKCPVCAPDAPDAISVPDAYFRISQSMSVSGIPYISEYIFN